MRRGLPALLFATLLAGGCANIGDASKPLPQRTLAVTCSRPVDTLIVLLPGAYDHAEQFVPEGFVAAIRDRGIAADVALVDASVAYYRERNIVARLDAEVVVPAVARGLRHVWFAGISIGGLGSLIYANEHRGAVDGLLLVAPYLGESPIVAEVEAAGGIARWMPGLSTTDSDGDGRRIWRWLKTLTSTSRDGPLPSAYLGYGVDDRFASAHRLFAAALPTGHVFTAPGTHDWPPWLAVWKAMLDAAPLPRDAGCRPAP